MRGASAYLVVNLRLPLELHLDLAQIRDGVLSRWMHLLRVHGLGPPSGSVNRKRRELDIIRKERADRREERRVNEGSREV